MRFLVCFLLFIATAISGVSQTIDYATVSGTNPSAQWEDFKWTWQNQDDRNFVISFTNEFNIDNVLFRLSWPERGPYYLEVVNGVV
ncbi:MAG: hypothetical protein GWN17_09620, partial [Candidatus Korarchaeota archaeon]|nr:hypothetical protein [Candidatus Korarchaeota archaeon]